MSDREKNEQGQRTTSSMVKRLRHRPFTAVTGVLFRSHLAAGERLNFYGNGPWSSG